MIGLAKQERDAALDWHGLLLVAVAGAWLTGIVLNSWMLIPSFLLLTIAALVLGSTIILWSQSSARYFLLLVLCILLGAWRYATVSPIGDPEAISTFIGLNKLEIRGTIADEPKLESHSTLLIISTNALSINAGTSWLPARGQLEVQILGSVFDAPYAPHYGDTINLQGKLLAPPPHSSPNIFASMLFPRLQISSQAGFSPMTLLYHLRIRLAGIILQALPQPFAALLIALLLSLRTPALKPLILYFNVTGTAHLIAPSGFKVTQVAGLMRSSTQWLYERERQQEHYLLPAQKRQGNWKRRLATIPVILCIVVYTFLSGGGPAALRAGIMGILLILAPRLGRVYNVYTALALVGLLMSLLDPFVLWDVGFQLSFLGTLGIVLLTPLFLRSLRFLARLPIGHICAENIAVTLAAEIATWPILAMAFYQVSLIALITNLLTVPFLGTLLLLGLTVSGAGLLSLQLSILCGWIARPVLWYIANIISRCATLPDASLPLMNMSAAWAWTYYALLALVTALLLRRWPPVELTDQVRPTARFLSHRSQWLLKSGVALLIVLATGRTILTAQPFRQLTASFLQSGTAGAGGALLISTPGGRTVLINEGANASVLAQLLDNHVPFWQRSLDMLILMAPTSNNLAGVQDVITRYHVGEVVDAGMLHPSTGYALWRRTVAERKLPYAQVRQGTTITLDKQISFQVLWPLSPLHKGSDETKSNALILRLVAPGFRMLLLDTAALSAYALKEVSGHIDPTYLQANIVQIMGESGKAFPPELAGMLQTARPSLLIVTTMPISSRQHKPDGTGAPAPPVPTELAFQIVQVAQMSTLGISSDGHHLSIASDDQGGI